VHPSSIAVELAPFVSAVPLKTAPRESSKLERMKPQDPRNYDFDGFHYFGDMIGEMAHGIGTLTAPNGTQYEGEWKENRKHGYGRRTEKDGSYYEGYFAVNEKNGHGIEVDANGCILREGNWEKGQFVEKSASLSIASKSATESPSLMIDGRPKSRAENSCVQHRFRYHWTCSCFLLTALSCFICTHCARNLQDMKCTRCGQVSD
jgi:hypothetical protein